MRGVRGLGLVENKIDRQRECGVGGKGKGVRYMSIEVLRGHRQIYSYNIRFV